MERFLNAKTIYTFSSAFVWAAIIVASAVILQGSTYFEDMVPILGGGAVWFVILLPTALFRGKS